jgi:hypothetical protein
MKRRGFLGFLGGAAVAGPSMAKQAVAATLSDMSVVALSGGALDQGLSQPVGGYGSSSSHLEWAASQLAKIGMRTAEQHAYHALRQPVVTLDPDLAGYRSMALHQKLSIQRDRNYWRSLEQERGYLQAMVAGWF